MSSSNSTSPKPDQKLKTMIVAVEDKRTGLNNPEQGYSPQEDVPERTITEVVSVRKSIERPYFGLEDYVLTCNICNKGFPSANALFSHQITHKLDQELERKRKNLEPSTSNDKISFGQFESIGGVCSNVRSTTFPSFNSGFTRRYHVTPYRSFIRDTSYGSSSRDPLVPYYSPHALSLEVSLGQPSNTIGSSINNNNGLSLELSLGPCKSIGGRNNNITDLNMPVRPRVSRYHYYNNYNPLDSITGKVPLLENVSGSSYLKKLTSGTKGKNKIGVLEDHDEDKPEEAETLGS